MREVLARWQASKETLLMSARASDGRVYAKAFPGRAAILVRLLSLSEHDIKAVFEKPQSQKIGCYLPGTRIPILSDDVLLAEVPKPRKILNLAWHINTEIRSYLKEMDPNFECVDIFKGE